MFTLRYYEKVGLLSSVKRSSNGYRLYAESDIAWIEFLQRLKATGMFIQQMQETAYGVMGTVTGSLFLYTPEIYPTRIRAIGTAFATAWLRLASALGPTVVGFVLGAKGIPYVFILFTFVFVIGALLALRMIETREKMLEEIAS